MDKGCAYYIHTLKAVNWQIPLVFQGSTTFIYDGDGGRVKKISPDGTQSIYIGGAYEVTQNPDNTSNTIKSVFLGENRICETVSGSVYYFHQDHIGSSNVITDDTGKQVACYEYKPYGETSKVSGSFSTDIRFTGQRLDSSTSLYYYGARYYDPELGRFIQPDTIVQAPFDPQSLNRYSYCRNNPINYVDPTGHKNIFKRFWDWLTGSIGNIIGVIVGAAVAIVSGNLWLGFQAYSMTSSIINSAMAGNWGGLAGGIVGGLIGGAFGYTAAVAGASLFTTEALRTFGAGFLTGAIEFGAAGFGSGFGYALGSGSSFSDAMSAGLVSGGISAAVGGVLQGSYHAGWQNIAHGASKEQITAAKANTLGVYRNPDKQGYYQDDPAIYQKTKMGYYGAGGALKKDYGLLGAISTGEMFMGSERIFVYGNPNTKIPSSWQAAIWDKTGYAPSTRWDTYGWGVVNEETARQLTVTKQAEAYFSSIHNDK